MQKRLPKAVMQGGKMGFSLPMRAWVAKMQTLVQRQVFDGRGVAIGLLDPKQVARINSTPAPRQPAKLWTLLVLEYWLREHEVEHCAS
jgi:hypothetical protein